MTSLLMSSLQRRSALKSLCNGRPEFDKVHNTIAISIDGTNDALALEEAEVLAGDDAQSQLELDTVKEAITRRVEPIEDVTKPGDARRAATAIVIIIRRGRE